MFTPSAAQARLLSSLHAACMADRASIPVLHPVAIKRVASTPTDIAVLTSLKPLLLVVEAGECCGLTPEGYSLALAMTR